MVVDANVIDGRSGSANYFRMLDRVAIIGDSVMIVIN